MSKQEKPSVASTDGFALWCTLHGFDLQKFDAWLAAQQGRPVHVELSEKRNSAWLAILEHREQEALLYLELMLTRARMVAREDFLLPGAQQAAKFRKSQSDRRKGKQKADDAFSDRDSRIWKAYKSADGARGVIKILAIDFDISERQIARILKRMQTQTG